MRFFDAIDIQRVSCKEYKLDYAMLLNDLLFFFIGIYAFYDSTILAISSVIIIIFISKILVIYKKDISNNISKSFIEFLNYINSNLTIGMTFEHSILSFENDKVSVFDRSITTAFESLIKAIKVGIDRRELLNLLYEVFPITDARRFGNMLLQSMSTGANQSYIVNITLDKLYIKHQTESEIQTILFQKRAEQIILCLAPMLIILMIKRMSPDYLHIMYTTLIGRLIMSFSFGLIIVMKFISKKIINIRI